MSNIGSVFNTAFSPLVSIVGDIIEWLQDLSSKLSNGFSNLGNGITNMIDSIGNLDNLILDGISALFIPTSENRFADSQLIHNTISNKFMFVENFKTAISNLNSTPTEMNIPITWGSYSTNISFAWYEPHRGKIKSGLSTIFYIGTSISIFGLIAGAFGLVLPAYKSNGIMVDYSVSDVNNNSLLNNGSGYIDGGSHGGNIL